MTTSNRNRTCETIEPPPRADAPRGSLKNFPPNPKSRLHQKKPHPLCAKTPTTKQATPKPDLLCSRDEDDRPQGAEHRQGRESECDTEEAKEKRVDKEKRGSLRYRSLRSRAVCTGASEAEVFGKLKWVALYTMSVYGLRYKPISLKMKWLRFVRA
ncbi:hypothetical protein Bca4012_024584 [Brassica carinata]